MDAHMLIEVDHLSEVGREQVLALAEGRGYPLVSSHTGTGGTWTPAELRRVYALGGFATARPDDPAKLPERILELRGYGHGRYVGVGLGTDTGGFSTQPGPPAHAKARPLRYPFDGFVPGVRFARQRTGERSFDLNTDGVAHYGLLADLLADTRPQRRGAPALGVLFRSADAYVRMWERTGTSG
jgi:hypothetical protein